MPHMNHLESAARRKLKAVPDWKAYSYEVVGDCYLIEGKIPEGTYAKGARKGQPRWGKADGQKTVLTQADVDAEIALYEKTTGSCRDCFGNGKTLVKASVKEGTVFGPCSRCGGSGKAI